MTPITTIRILTAGFILALFISGLTAIPLVSETRALKDVFTEGSAADLWIEKIYGALKQTAAKHPYLFYGYDWLAFAHFLFALLFVGAYRDPVRNRWLYEFGLIACALIIPFALVAGSYRGIPFWWQLIDCSFGVIGSIPLFICRRKIQQIITTHKKLNYGI